MRRFSQRNHLVTLSDINITPLLDLAFVLLIIFVITTPLLEQSLKLQLPVGGLEDKTPRTKDDIKTIEVVPGSGGYYVMGGKRMSLNEIESALVQAFKANPKLGVYIRADRAERFESVTAVLDVCQRNGIMNATFKTLPDRR
jgi:biopolymer transport protein ExbD